MAQKSSLATDFAHQHEKSPARINVEFPDGAHARYFRKSVAEDRVRVTIE